MMLSRTGRDRASLSIAARSVGANGHHGVVWVLQVCSMCAACTAALWGQYIKRHGTKGR